MVPIIIAHRGARNEFPENTIPSISAALAISGISATEFDVELTKDKKGVVAHQETVIPDAEFVRIEYASRNYTSRDWVSQYSKDQIIKLDAGSYMARKFDSVRIPTLQQVLELNWGSQVACIELKDATFWSDQPDLTRPRQVVAAVIDDLRNFSGQLNVLSFNPQILLELHTLAPGIPTTLALWTEWQSRRADAIRLAVTSAATTITIADFLVLDDPDWVKDCHQAGLQIHVYPVSPTRGESEFESWTAESQNVKWLKLAQLGVDGLVTDFPRQTVAFFREQGMML